MVKNITEDIENKIIELKNDGKTINNIINDIFNNFNVKITKYKVNKIITSYNTQESTSKSVSDSDSDTVLERLRLTLFTVQESG